MSKLATKDLLGRKSTRREPLNVLEAKREDRSIEKLLKVRENRVSRFEREVSQAREEWRKARVNLRQAKLQWRDARTAAQEEWQRAREEFFRMSTTSGQFRQAKAIYERMKATASQMHLEAKEAAQSCRALRRAFFDAIQRLDEIRRQQEKLSVLRDEVRAMNSQGGD